ILTDRTPSPQRSRHENYRSPMRLNALLDAALEDANYDGLLAQRFSFVAATAMSAPSSGGALKHLTLSCNLPYPVNLIISPVAVDGYARVWRLFVELGMAHASLLQVRDKYFKYFSSSNSKTTFLEVVFEALNTTAGVSIALYRIFLSSSLVMK